MNTTLELLTALGLSWEVALNEDKVDVTTFGEPKRAYLTRPISVRLRVKDEVGREWDIEDATLDRAVARLLEEML